MRLAGWEQRLDAVLRDFDLQPYVLGMHDCNKLACASIVALTGVDHWPDLEGQYSTREEAIAFIATLAPSFEEAVDTVTGFARVAVRRAQRGDLVMTFDGTDKHLGVCIGRHFAGLTAEGVVYLPMTLAQTAWRVS